VFAVDAETGHLTEIRSCPSSLWSWSLGRAVEVDRADWRAYSAVFAVYDSNAVILYAVTATGELWWRRQEAPGAAPGTLVRVADAINWRHDVVFAARPGYLELGDYGGPVRTFRHDGWASGGTAVFADGELFTTFHGPAITAMASHYAVGTWNGRNYRVWRVQSNSAHDDAWYASGLLPAGLSGATGDGIRLYGVDSGGGVVLLEQSQPFRCALASGWNWYSTSRAPGHFSRVVVPLGAGPAGPAAVAPPPPPALDCGGITDNTHPWEWQG
jgi:hypothetical protein